MKTINTILEETYELVSKNLLPQYSFGSKLVLTKETLNEQIEKQSDNGHNEANIFYLTWDESIADQDGDIPTVNLKVEEIWVNKETLEVVDTPKWHADRKKSKEEK